MRGRPPPTPEAVRRIRVERRHHSIRSTARLLGISPGTVARYAPGGRQVASEADHQRAAAMYRRGFTLREIAAKLYRSHETVRGWLLRAGVEMRKRGARSPF